MATSAAGYNLLDFAKLSTSNITRSRVAKLVIGKAAVAFTVMETISLWPKLQNIFFGRACTRPLMQWAKPSVIVTEAARIALHVGVLKLLEGHVPSGRFSSFQHLAIFFDSIWQYFLPSAIRNYVSYVPLNGADVLQVMTTLTTEEINASVVSQLVSNCAAWAPVYFLKRYQGRATSGWGLAAFQLVTDTAALSIVHWGTLTLAAKYAPQKNLIMYLTCWGAMYAVGAFGIGGAAGLFAVPVSNFIDKFTGKGKIADVPTEHLERLQYLSRFSALELASFFDLAVYILGSNFDNNCRLHVAKLLADILQYQNAVMRDLITKKREFALHASTDVVTADMMDQMGGGAEGIPLECVCGCGTEIKVAMEVKIFSCGHILAAKCEESYTYEWCRGCPAGNGTIVITVPDEARTAMTENLRKTEGILFDRWYNTHLLPDYLYYCSWHEVATYATKNNIATDFEVSMITGDAVPRDNAWWDTIADFLFLILDITPSEWNPMLFSVNVV